MTVLRWPEEESQLAAHKGGRVALAFSRRHVFLRTTHVPDVPVQAARAIVSLRVTELFPLPAGDAAFDIALTDEVDAAGRLAILAGVSAVELRRAYAACHALGVKVGLITAEASAAEGAAKRAGVTDAAVVGELDGKRTIDLVIGGRLRYSRLVHLDAPVEAEIIRSATAANVPAPAIVPLLPDDKAPDGAFAFELPERLAARTREKESSRMRLALLMLGASLALAAFVAVDRRDRAAVEGVNAAAAQRKARKAQVAAKLRETEAGRVAAVNNELTQAFRPGQPLGDVVATVGNRLPAGSWLSGVTLERGKPATLRGTVMRSEDVAKYLESLRGERRLRDVRLIFATDGKIDQTPVVQFSLSAFPVGNLPLAPMGRAGSRS